jgi:hypothetical protein
MLANGGQDAATTRHVDRHRLFQDRAAACVRGVFHRRGVQVGWKRNDQAIQAGKSQEPIDRGDSRGPILSGRARCGFWSHIVGGYELGLFRGYQSLRQAAPHPSAAPQSYA